MKSVRRESSEEFRAPNDDTYYMLTLDPSVKDHRVIALLIDYTSRSHECPFYRPDNKERHCSIAPEFTVIWRDCGGRCFVGGLTCPVIVDHDRELEKPEGTDMTSVDRG
jgi:hypothetical protein